MENQQNDKTPEGKISSAENPNETEVERAKRLLEELKKEKEDLVGTETDSVETPAEEKFEKTKSLIEEAQNLLNEKPKRDMNKKPATDPFYTERYLDKESEKAFEGKQDKTVDYHFDYDIGKPQTVSDDFELVSKSTQDKKGKVKSTHQRGKTSLDVNNMLSGYTTKDEAKSKDDGQSIEVAQDEKNALLEKETILGQYPSGNQPNAEHDLSYRPAHWNVKPSPLETHELEEKIIETETKAEPEVEDATEAEEKTETPVEKTLAKEVEEPTTEETDATKEKTSESTSLTEIIEKLNHAKDALSGEEQKQPTSLIKTQPENVVGEETSEKAMVPENAAENEVENPTSIVNADQSPNQGSSQNTPNWVPYEEDEVFYNSPNTDNAQKSAETPLHEVEGGSIEEIKQNDDEEYKYKFFFKSSVDGRYYFDTEPRNPNDVLAKDIDINTGKPFENVTSKETKTTEADNQNENKNNEKVSQVEEKTENSQKKIIENNDLKNNNVQTKGQNFVLVGSDADDADKEKTEQELIALQPTEPTAKTINYKEFVGENRENLNNLSPFNQSQGHIGDEEWGTLPEPEKNSKKTKSRENRKRLVKGGFKVVNNQIKENDADEYEMEAESLKEKSINKEDIAEAKYAENDDEANPLNEVDYNLYNNGLIAEEPQSEAENERTTVPTGDYEPYENPIGTSQFTPFIEPTGDRQNEPTEPAATAQPAEGSESANGGEGVPPSVVEPTAAQPTNEPAQSLAEEPAQSHVEEQNSAQNEEQQVEEKPKKDNIFKKALKAIKKIKLNKNVFLGLAIFSVLMSCISTALPVFQIAAMVFGIIATVLAVEPWKLVPYDKIVVAKDTEGRKKLEKDKEKQKEFHKDLKNDMKKNASLRKQANKEFNKIINSNKFTEEQKQEKLAALEEKYKNDGLTFVPESDEFQFVSEEKKKKIEEEKKAEVEKNEMKELSEKEKNNALTAAEKSKLAEYKKKFPSFWESLKSNIEKKDDTSVSEEKETPESKNEVVTPKNNSGWEDYVLTEPEKISPAKTKNINIDDFDFGQIKEPKKVAEKTGATDIKVGDTVDQTKISPVAPETSVFNYFGNNQEKSSGTKNQTSEHDK